MENFVRQALTEHNLMKRYKSRPAYQQNDSLGWINRVVRPETRQKRLQQMLKELQDGTLYMKMQYSGP